VPVKDRRRMPVLPEHLRALVGRFAGVSATLSDIRDVCFCLVSFAGFLRSNELCNIRWCDIHFAKAYFSLFIPRSKTDQYYHGCIYATDR
jgi:integrase